MEFDFRKKSQNDLCLCAIFFFFRYKYNRILTYKVCFIIIVLYHKTQTTISFFLYKQSSNFISLIWRQKTLPMNKLKPMISLKYLFACVCCLHFFFFHLDIKSWPCNCIIYILANMYRMFPIFFKTTASLLLGRNIDFFFLKHPSWLDIQSKEWIRFTYNGYVWLIK